MKRDDPAAAPSGALPSVEQPGRTDLDWPHATGLTERVLRKVESKVRRRRRRRRALLAGAAAFVVGGFAWHLFETRGRPPSAPPSSGAVVSAPRHETLPDGSRVELRDGSSVAPQFTPALRRVVLQHGEAHFTVTKNVQRPFIVDVGGVEVRAVGTAFSVQLGPKAIEVVVSEGRVAIEKADAPPPEPAAARRGPDAAEAAPEAVRRSTLATVDAGRIVVVDLTRGAGALPPSQVSVLSEAELNQRLAWRTPVLEFSATPLADVVPMINRHSRVRLVLGDDELQKVPVSGILRADNLDTLFRFLKSDYGVTTERRSETEIVLRKAR